MDLVELLEHGNAFFSGCSEHNLPIDAMTRAVMDTNGTLTIDMICAIRDELNDRLIVLDDAIHEYRTSLLDDAIDESVDEDEIVDTGPHEQESDDS